MATLRNKTFRRLSAVPALSAAALAALARAPSHRCRRRSATGTGRPQPCSLPTAMPARRWRCTSWAGRWLLRRLRSELAI